MLLVKHFHSCGKGSVFSPPHAKEGVDIITSVMSLYLHSSHPVFHLITLITHKYAIVLHQLAAENVGKLIPYSAHYIHKQFAK